MTKKVLLRWAAYGAGTILMVAGCWILEGAGGGLVTLGIMLILGLGIHTAIKEDIV